MNVKAARNAAASTRARLLQYAKQHDDNYLRVLTRFAIERLLFRLVQTAAAELFVLKGAMLFVTWPDHAFRPTGDLDLLGRGDPDPAAIAGIFTTICQVQVPEDGIVFDPATIKVEPMRETEMYRGVRLTLKGELAQAVIHVQVDIGFGDHVYPPPKRETFPSLLPELPAAVIQMYPPETVIVEKFEAMIRFGELNGRIKDFYDIWITSRTFAFDMATLVEAVRGTLKRRETALSDPFPAGLSDTYAKIVEERGLWTGFLTKTSPSTQPPPFEDLQQELRRFLLPVIANLEAPGGVKGRWSPVSREWR